MKHRGRKSAIFKASLEVDFSSELSQAYYVHLSQSSDKSWARRCLLEMTTVENMFIIRLQSWYFYKPFTASASCSNACVRMLRGVLLVHMLVVKDQLFQSLWSLVISHFRFWEWKSVLYIFTQRAIWDINERLGLKGSTEPLKWRPIGTNKKEPFARMTLFIKVCKVCV